MQATGRLKQRLTAKSLLETTHNTQLELEKAAVESGMRRYRTLVKDAVERGEGGSLKTSQRLLAHWYPRLVAAIGTLHAQLKVDPGFVEGGTIMLPALNEVGGEAIAVITINAALSMTMAEPDGVTAVKLTNEVGRSVLAEISRAELEKYDKAARKKRRTRIQSQIDAGEEPDFEKFREGEEELLRKLDARFKNVTPTRINWWARRSLTDAGDFRRACVHLGARLIYELMATASSDDYDKKFAPAFIHFDLRKGGKTTGFIKLDPKVIDLLESGHEIRQVLHPKHLPMIIEPGPWIEGGPPGGYITNRVPLVSKFTPEQKRALAAANKSLFYECFQAVVKTKFAIDTRTHDVQRAMYEAGGGQIRKKKNGRPAIPHANDKPEIQRPAGYRPDAPLKQRWSGVDPEKKKAYKREAAQIIAENKTRRAERRSFLEKHAVADMFRDSSGFYQPGRCCFRYRWYPVTAELHHQGDDIAKSLIRLARAKKPGESGERWLRIHAANTFGNGAEKMGLKRRAQWAIDNLQDIERSAVDPLRCDFWRQAEKPFQFLAACRAVIDPNGEGATLPIFMDGTCNGLQHYAALGRDLVGAAAVNMVANEEPNDVYSQVATAVQQTLRDILKGESTIDVPKVHDVRGMAEMLLPYIDRATVKQPVMTTVYGVTASGARKQLKLKLKEREIAGTLLRLAAKFLTVVTFEAIGKVCVAAKKLMNWIRTCTEIVVAKGHTMRWRVLPLDIPVVQSYRDIEKAQIKTVLQRITIAIDNEACPVDKRRQKNGAPANFIHSCGDAAHMYMTARAARADDIDFIGRHDQYGGHAADGDLLGYHSRDQMVELHNNPILESTVADWRRWYKVDLPDPPPPGEYRLSSLYGSKHFFS